MLNVAKKESQKSSCRCQHGAAVSKGNRLLGKGHNSYKPHPTWGGGPLKTLHAEAAAIRDAIRRGIDVRGATIYVVRTSENSQMSKPCPSCQQLIEDYGIRKVVYTNEEGEVVSEWPLGYY